jgi:hypothetical protein
VMPAELWATGEMLCLHCGQNKGYIHAWMLNSEPVECPECGEMGCVPAGAAEVWFDSC